MDRRQRKTRKAIFDAFILLLSQTHYERITVGQIIAQADIGRATFYAHFETKEALLQAMCRELFDHVFELEQGSESAHSHLFDCHSTDSVFLHLLQHLQKNDNRIWDLLSCRNNDLFLAMFREDLKKHLEGSPELFSQRRAPELPEALWNEHVAATFVETLRWWMETGLEVSAEQLHRYFTLLV